MAQVTQGDRGRSWGWVRWIGWGAAAALVLFPLVAMRFTPEVNWTAGDFMVAIVMIGTVGLALEVVVRATANWSYRLGAAVALGTAFLLTWSNLAVGYIGSENNPYNSWFLVVVAIAIVGAVVARFRASGMAAAMAVTAVAHAAVGIGGFPSDTRTGPITIVFTGLWLASAWLFRKAASR